MQKAHDAGPVSCFAFCILHVAFLARLRQRQTGAARVVRRPAVFLDRDGTIIEERGFIDRLDMIAMFPWTGDALRLLKRAGYVVVVATNQSAVARGMIEEAFLHEVHRAIDAKLAGSGGSIDAYYYCPHLPNAVIDKYRQVCRCRKPSPGLIEQACRELELDLHRSVMIGDRWRDIASGAAAGTRTVLVRSGHGAHEEAAPEAGVAADAIVNNLMEAVGWTLRTSSR
jgi:D-glycero-D-manno-heptose 1,7-bisphosphate phosphatase